MELKSLTETGSSLPIPDQLKPGGPESVKFTNSQLTPTDHEPAA